MAVYLILAASFWAGIVSGVVAGVVVGGLLAAGRGLWKTRKRPALTLETVEKLTPDVIDTHPCAYARVGVRNDKGKDRATGVNVRIAGVDSESDGVGQHKLDFLKSRFLAWADVDRNNPTVMPGVLAVNSNDTRYIDLAHLNASVDNQVIIDIRPQPGNKMNYLGAGQFTFKLAVSADNADTRHYVVDVVHDGEHWDGDHSDAANHLKIANLRRA